MNAACRQYGKKTPRWGTRKQFPKEIRRRARMRGYSVNSNNTNKNTRKNRPTVLTGNENLTYVNRPYRNPYGFEGGPPRSGSFFRESKPFYPPLPPSPLNEENTENDKQTKNAKHLFSPKQARRGNKNVTRKRYLSLRKLRENLNTHHLFPNY